MSLATLSADQLSVVTGGFSMAQIKTIENNAVKFAQHSLHTSPVFLGDVNNSVKGPVFSPKSGVLVSTGDEASPQFYTGRVQINKQGAPVALHAIP